MSLRDFDLYDSDIDTHDSSKIAVHIAIKDALLHSVLQGRLSAFRLGSVHSPLADANFQETDQNSIYALGMDYACGNGIMEYETDRIFVEKEIDFAIQYFSSKNFSFIL